ncbi:unnamed protein product [Adineta steineri]|uniref:Uncharacterized protein n=1 Tax=Adineta steineri TaxID=433720 RepID=A0A814NWM3_9BILA|nr:unnamed protein product [Adineta steineri]CAF1572316.1 unnamed protein product [Adineta steineri]
MINVAIHTNKCCWSCILYANKRTHNVSSKESPNSVAKHDETAPYPMQFADDIEPQHKLGYKILTPNCTTLVLKGLYMLPEIIFGLKKMKMDIKCEHLEDSHLTNKHFYIRSTLQPDGSNISKVEREYIPPGENEQIRKAYVKPIGAWINVPYVIGSVANASYDFLLEQNDQKILSLAENIYGDIDIQCDIIKTPETERIANEYLNKYYKFSPLPEEFNKFWYTYVENKELYKYAKPDESKDIYDEIVKFKDEMKQSLDKFLENKTEIWSPDHGIMKVSPKGTSDDIIFDRKPHMICVGKYSFFGIFLGWCYQYRNVTMRWRLIDLFFNYVNPNVCCGYTQLVEMDYGIVEKKGSTYLRGYLTEKDKNDPVLPYVIGALSGFRLTFIYYSRLMARSDKQTIRNARIIRKLSRFLNENKDYQLGTTDENILAEHLPPFSLLACPAFEKIVTALDSNHPLVQALMNIRNLKKHYIETHNYYPQ